MPFDARLGSFIPSNQLLQQQSSYHLAMQQQFQLSKGLYWKYILKKIFSFFTAMELLFQLFRSDRIYNRSLKVNGMTHHMAMSIFKIKAFLSYFIHLVPENLAGKLNDSEGVKKYFVNIIDVCCLININVKFKLYNFSKQFNKKKVHRFFTIKHCLFYVLQLILFETYLIAVLEFVIFPTFSLKLNQLKQILQPFNLI